MHRAADPSSSIIICICLFCFSYFYNMTIWQYWWTRDKAEPPCHFQLWWANHGWLPASHPVTLPFPLPNRTTWFLSIGCSPSGIKLPLVWVLPGPWFPQGIWISSSIKTSTGCSSLLQCGPLHRQQENLYSSFWSISSPPSPALLFSGVFLTLSPAPYNPWQHFFFLTHIFTEVLHVWLMGSATSCSGFTKAVSGTGHPLASLHRSHPCSLPSCQHFGTYAQHTSL